MSHSSNTSNSKHLELNFLSNGIVSTNNKVKTFYSNLIDLVELELKLGSEGYNFPELFTGLDKDNPIFLHFNAYQKNPEGHVILIDEPLTQEEVNKNLLADILNIDKQDEEAKIAGIKISVNQRNCYSTERLKKIDFLGLKDQYSMGVRQISEITGLSGGGVYNLFNSIKLGTSTFMQVKTRIAMTILAKYFELISENRSTKVDEMNLYKEKVNCISEELNEILKSGNHHTSRQLKPIFEKLKDLTK